MKRTAWSLGAVVCLLGLAAFAGCSVSSGGAAQGTGDAGPGPSADASEDVQTPEDATVDAGEDASDCTSALPTLLSCTGLYTNVSAQTIASGVQPYAPAVPLWADGSDKNRWILLPAGAKIDRTDPNNWVFPSGTKVWKEFSRDGERKETRFFHKQSDGTWVWVSYVWNADFSDAVASPNGAALPLEDGAIYTVPTQAQCTQCHAGTPDHLLGFEEVSLGMAGATGLTLPQLASQGLLSPAPTSTSLTVADDGSGDLVHSLGWLHINCGVTCHNSNPTATATSVSMRLKLDATQLDGRSAAGMDPMVTTVGVLTTTNLWGHLDRIDPGVPSQSLIIYLTSQRGAGKQMPPLASVLVDTADVAILSDWISKMAPLDGGVDAGPAEDSGTDASSEDSGSADAGTLDAAPDAAGEGDAGATDAGDAGEVDAADGG
jgi:hypothetical protein